MRYIVLLLAGMLLAGGCGKQVEQVQLNALMDLITSGQWKVTLFKKGSETITDQFAAYSFQFKKNETVDAIKNGTVEKSGTWKGNATERTIQSSFGNVTVPLSLLNGTWLVSKTSTTFVEASQDVGNERLMLRLDKL
jgi:hypothetical protein